MKKQARTKTVGTVERERERERATLYVTCQETAKQGELPNQKKVQKNKEKLNRKGAFCQRQEAAITLIALVVTIVVLLILAGITIQLVLSDGGLFSEAQKSKEQTRIGELLDKFNVSEATVSLEKFGKPSLEDFINQVQNKEGYVEEAEKQEDGHYQVITEDGYVFDISIIEGSSTNDIIIDYIGKAGNLPPIMKVKNITTNSAEIELTRIEGITSYKYEYKKHSEESFETATGTNNICKLNNLTNGTLYDVKVTVVKEGKEIVVETNFVVGKLPVGGVIKLKSTTWANNKATAVVYHEETGNYKIEWQKTGGTTWNSGEMGVKEISIPNLSHNDTVLLRLNDGTSSGDEASMSVIDDIDPQNATISFTPETAKSGDNITATVTLTDNESGINNSNSKYEFNKSNEPLGIEDTSLYTGTFASTTTPTIKATSSGTWYLHVLSVDNAGNKLETVSKEIVITQTEIADLDRSQGSIEIAFVDKDNNLISANNVPTPKLGTGMTPIKWSGSTVTTTTTSDSEWYDYSQKKWANAQTSDGSMWVWIPRYSYKILYKNVSGTIIGYSDSDGITDINGNIVTGTKKQGAVEVKGTVDGKQIEKYVLHPAFQKFASDELTMANGGWKEELDGIWVAKFEASHADATSSSAGSSATMKIQPGVQSWRSIKVNDIFTKCSAYNSPLNSHMMKNSEWGCAAYLATSVYGKNGKITINDGLLLTGGGEGTAYTSNTDQSTTGNVYGIYDMSGGSWEYVASYVNYDRNVSGSLTSNGASLVNSTSGQLKQVYSKESSGELPYQANKGKYGDAVYETSSASDITTSWYGEYSIFPERQYPFFYRGGYFTEDSTAGVFYYLAATGNTEGGAGFRPVLTIP